MLPRADPRADPRAVQRLRFRPVCSRAKGNTAAAQTDKGAPREVVKPMKLCISFLVWEIHKPIAGDVGSNVGAGKMDNQCVEKIPLLVFCWMERRPPTVGRYPGAYLRSLG